MMDFSTLQGLTIPEGVVTQIAKDGVVLWALGGPVILEVEKITANTYAAETTYENEEFILFDIYPKTNGTVKVTYGGLTKTITDSSGVEEPNAQQVFFGTFNGVSDSVTTPTSGTLTIEGDCDTFGCGSYIVNSKNATGKCGCITEIKSFGAVEYLPNAAFGSLSSGACTKLTKVIIPKTIKRIGSSFISCTALVDVTLSNGITYIGNDAFMGCGFTHIDIPSSVTYIGDGAFIADNLGSVKILATTPAQLEYSESDDGTKTYNIFFVSDAGLEIIVPKGCGDTYKTAEGWSTYADYIVEAS